MGKKIKSHSVYVCQKCGAQSPKWQGKCNECGEWNSLVEETIKETKVAGAKVALEKSLSGNLFELANQEPDFEQRIPSGFAEVDRVLGGGFVSASVLLLGGEPGIGKSTLLLQIIGNLSKMGISCLYISGEESASQVAGRARRLGMTQNAFLKFLGTTNLEDCADALAKEKPQIVVIDSVQTIGSGDIESMPGTLSQVRAVAQRVMEESKTKGTISILVGHVTKEGTVAGPKLLEHMVDGVFYFEMAASGAYRMLRGQKNRFGAANEVSVFEMGAHGLVEVQNPSARFLQERAKELPGSSVVAHLEGSRPFLTEFQSLTSKCYQGYPRRTVQGVDQNRISVLLAVIERALGISFGNQDVYCKVASGNRIEEAAADLPLMMSLLSSRLDVSIDPSYLFIGEVGLGGEVRSVVGIGARLNEAKSVGLTRAIIPFWNLKEAKEVKGIQLVGIKRLDEAFRLLKAETEPPMHAGTPR